MNADRAVAVVAESQHGLVTRAQARARGISEDGIHRRLRAGLWERIHKGVYRLAGSQQSPEQTVMGVCLAGGVGTFASYASAALIWGLPGVGGRPEVTISGSRRVRLEGVIVHRAARLDRVDCVWHLGIPVTSVARTLIDLAGELDRQRLEAVVDHALAERMVPLTYLRSRLEALGRRGRRGTGMLADVIAVRLDGCQRPGTGFERLLQQALVGAGLPQIRREHEVCLPDGCTVRLDFAFVEAKLAVEADSYRYHSTLGDWSRDRTRNNELVALGWRTLPVTYRDLKADPAKVVDQIKRALDAGEVWNIDRA